jgi:hypothetical protein
MNKTESLLLIAAVAYAGFWWGKKRATVTATSAAQAQDQNGGLAWLGAWAA